MCDISFRLDHDIFMHGWLILLFFISTVVEEFYNVNLSEAIYYTKRNRREVHNEFYSCEAPSSAYYKNLLFSKY